MSQKYYFGSVTKADKFMSDKSHNYELAFHILPNIEESKLAEIKQELENLITSNGGAITYSKQPERTRLSYQIQHLKSSYFGYIHFTLPIPEEALKNINEYLRRHTEILRFLIVKTASDLQKNRDMLKQIKMRERADRKPKVAPKAPVTEAEEKKLDEELENIIGKL